MEQILTVLKRAPLFRDIPDQVLQTDLLPRGRVQEFTKGQSLIAPQQAVNHWGIVLSGRVHVTHIFPDGSFSLIQVLTVSHAVGADLIGTRSRISPYHAICEMPSRVLFFPADLILQSGSLEEVRRLQILQNLLVLKSDENMKKEYRLAILAQKGLRERILTYLTMQASKRNTNTFSIPFSREEMASFLCVNRTALSHELSLMQQEGILQFHKNTFTLLLTE